MSRFLILKVAQGYDWCWANIDSRGIDDPDSGSALQYKSWFSSIY